jgi:hypothetical protein
VDVGDLGPLVAGSDLRPVVDDALGDVGDDVAADGGGSGGAGGGEAGQEAFGGDVAGDQAPGGGSQGPPATGEEEDAEAADGTTQSTEAEPEAEPEAATTPSPTSAGGEQLADGTDGLPASRLTTCEPSVRASLPDAGALLLTGTATVDGAPALVYGFAAPSARPTVLVALVAVDGCRTVTIQTYARD